MTGGLIEPAERLAIRPYQSGDLAALYEVCVRTGNAGADARGLYRNDDLLPDLFVGPYVHLEPELAFVLEGAGRAVGYVVGTADTARFADAYRRRWIPHLADRYPRPPEAPLSAEDVLLLRHHWPEQMVWPELEEFPAHLHIDLLPAWQGLGHGRRLMEAFLAAAFQAGAGGVHVGVDVANLRALGFYDRLGFQRLEVPSLGPAVYLGRRLP